MSSRKREEKKMNKTLKVILIIIAVLVLLCCCAGTALAVTGVVSMGSIMKTIESNTTDKPEEVAAIASDIADFEMPAGYDKPFGMKFASFSFAGYMSSTSNSTIMLAQLPPNLNINVEDIMKAMQEKSNQGQVTVNGGEMVSVEDRPVTIRGQQATLVIKEGQSSDGQTTRVGTVAFTGKQGNPAIMLISSPADSWDDAAVNALIASMK
jgi:hypothetical protein